MFHPHESNLLRKLSARAVVRMVLAFALSLTASSSMVSAGEISYNLDPTDVMKEELWRLPFGGHLMISLDGERILVASRLDSAFYVVDSRSQEFVKLSMPFYESGDSGRVSFQVDNQLRYMAYRLTRAGTSTDHRFGVVNLDNGSFQWVEDRRGSSTLAISSSLDRSLLFAGGKSILIRASTGDTISELPEYSTAWFDDSRGLLYASNGGAISELQSESGDFIRGFAVFGAPRVTVRRDSTTDWLYALSIETNVNFRNNIVVGINTVTNERVVFDQHYRSNEIGSPRMNAPYPQYWVDDGVLYASGFDWSGSPQPIWSFNAQTKSHQTVLDERFDTTRAIAKSAVFDRARGLYYHSWQSSGNSDSVNLKCNVIVPVSTGAGSDEGPHDDEIWLVYEGQSLTIHSSRLISVDNVEVFDLTGRLLYSQGFHSGSTLPASVNLPLPNGSYLCVVESSGESTVAKFTVSY